MVSPESVFAAANLLAVAGWLLLALAPRNRRAATVAATVLPVLLSLLYVGLLAAHWAEARGSFSSLHGVADLFSNEWVLLAGWVHYLSFDLVVGAWETQDAVERGVPRWLVIPCLFVTFLFGPAGWLSYRMVRTVHGASRPGLPAAATGVAS